MFQTGHIIQLFFYFSLGESEIVFQELLYLMMNWLSYISYIAGKIFESIYLRGLTTIYKQKEIVFNSLLISNSPEKIFISFLLISG